jgi:hypothetical protein
MQKQGSRIDTQLFALPPGFQWRSCGSAVLFQDELPAVVGLSCMLDAGALGVVLFLAVTPYGRSASVRMTTSRIQDGLLDRDDVQRRDGIRLMSFGVAEPISHLAAPPSSMSAASRQPGHPAKVTRR